MDLLLNNLQRLIYILKHKQTIERWCGKHTRSVTIMIIIQKKEEKTSCLVDFAVLANVRLKIKESEKRDDYLNLAKELKKKPLWNMMVTVIPIVILRY